MSLATFRSVLVSEMGSLGSATADTRSRSLVADRIRHFRIMGCLSPTTGEICWKTLFTGSPSFRRDQHSTLLLVWLDAQSSTCSDMSRARNLRWVMAGKRSLRLGSAVQRMKSEGRISVSMRHFSLTTPTHTL